MVFSPRSPREIRTELEAELDVSIAGLSNFGPTTFAGTWLDAYAEQLSAAEHKACAAQLGMFADYAGNTSLTNADLDDLGIDADPEELNEYMREEQLDELAQLVGVTRDPGTRAIGEVEFRVATDQIEIEEGFTVGTRPDSRTGEFQSFRVDANGDGAIDETSPAVITPAAGSTTVVASVIAEEVGSDGNVGPGAITFIPTPKPGVETVKNDNAFAGGVDRQPTESFRQDVKQSLLDNSGGGTARGLEGFIENEVTSVNEAKAIERFDLSPTEVEVVVEGGDRTAVLDAIERGRPIGVLHELLRPTQIGISTRSDIVGDALSLPNVRSALGSLVNEIELGGTISLSQITQGIFRAEAELDNVQSLSLYIETVGDEIQTYVSGTNDYKLQYAQLGKIVDEQHRFRETVDTYSFQFEADTSALTPSFEAIVDDEIQELVVGTDVNVDATSGLASTFTLTGTVTPDLGTNIRVAYEASGTGLESVTDESGNTFVIGTDVTLEDTNGDGFGDTLRWSGTAVPADGDRVFVDYTAKRSVRGDLPLNDRERGILPVGSVTLVEGDT